MFTSALYHQFSLRKLARHSLQIALLAVIASGAMLIPQQVYAFEDHTAFCNTVTGAPAVECMALMDIYDNTGGPSWTTKNGWGVSTSICSWTGISCTSSHVTSLSVPSNHLTGTFSFSHGSLNSLTNLIISTNQLT